MRNKMIAALLCLATVLFAGCGSQGRGDYRPPVPVITPTDPSGNSDDKPQASGVNMWAIDMTVLNVGQKHYAIWSGWDKYYEAKEGNGQYMYIAEMTLSDKKPYVSLGRRHLLTEATLPWELKVGEAFSLVEGPCVMYHGDDIFLLYSTRGSWTVNYKIGIMKLIDKSKPLDPASWEKKSTPFFSGLTTKDAKGSFGAGHCSVTTSPDDSEYWLNFHAKTSTAGGWTDRKVFFQRILFDAQGYPYMEAQNDPAVPLTRPSGEYEIDLLDGVASPSRTFMNPVRDGADPWIVKVNGKYYVCKSGDRGVRIAESRFITKFENGKQFVGAATTVWQCPGTADRWNEGNLWAPELHFIDGKWYVFYAAGHQSEAPYWQHRSGALVSSSGPFGPYEEHDSEPLFTGEYDD